jgi:cytochrome c oxidase subunit 3
MSYSSERNNHTYARFGMWLFLFTEIMMFSALFLLYTSYRIRFPDDFSKSTHVLSLPLGAINSAILLTGSLFTTLTISALRRGSRRLSIALLAGTVLMGGWFLFNHYLEWSKEILQGIYPNAPHLDQMARGEILFFGLYYVTLGLHGLHVFIGSIILGVMAILIARRRVTAEDTIKLENSGLFWHMVDIFWIFIFPLYYLLR